MYIKIVGSIIYVQLNQTEHITNYSTKHETMHLHKANNVKIKTHEIKLNKKQ